MLHVLITIRVNEKCNPSGLKTLIGLQAFLMPIIRLNENNFKIINEIKVYLDIIDYK